MASTKTTGEKSTETRKAFSMEGNLETYIHSVHGYILCEYYNYGVQWIEVSKFPPIPNAFLVSVLFSPIVSVLAIPISIVPKEKFLSSF